MYLTSDAQVRNILVVDDSAFEQRMLVDLLSEMPYRVSVALNGEQGYQLALSGPPGQELVVGGPPQKGRHTSWPCRASRT